MNIHDKKRIPKSILSKLNVLFRTKRVLQRLENILEKY